MKKQQVDDSYAKSMVDYAALQEEKLEKRQNESQRLAKELEKEDLAEMKSRKLVREINKRNASYIAHFNPSAVG